MAASCVSFFIFPFRMETGRTSLAFHERSHFPFISQIDFKRAVAFFFFFFLFSKNWKYSFHSVFLWTNITVVQDREMGGTSRSSKWVKLGL